MLLGSTEGVAGGVLGVPGVAAPATTAGAAPVPMAAVSFATSFASSSSRLGPCAISLMGFMTFLPATFTCSLSELSTGVGVITVGSGGVGVGSAAGDATGVSGTGILASTGISCAGVVTGGVSAATTGASCAVELSTSGGSMLGGAMGFGVSPGTVCWLGGNSGGGGVLAAV